MSDKNTMPDIGIVVIGRNEGERLRRSLISVHGRGYPTIYVDSGSIDGSVELAKCYCSQVLQLDPVRPFSAARARNEGLEVLRRIAPATRFVQFLDGDCTLEEKWLSEAHEFMKSHDEAAIVCGHLQEKDADSTIFSKLCEIEWSGNTGEIDACGGIFFGRIAALQTVGMFNESMIAGEEPELCHRLRSSRWKIIRIDQPMAVHESDISKISQLLQRARRCGHSYAHSHYVHRETLGAFKQRSLASVIFWGALLPLTSLLLFPFSVVAATSVLLLYVPLWIKVYVNGVRRSRLSKKLAAINSSYIVIGKFAQFVGVIDFYRTILRKKEFRLIEYK
ncbi:Glycosyltransferase, catalytic subunit of cellulose synthase and poly-beta-1,6-N-acetylglucosamine synthase [Microbulbifer donghaiensis]|uniref:Glycosyltransferase, catalytic subunit of cellulose synthase and poly-beta-1,6-N-acetylglucosamine synthase n=1 Tax=Microbulbifer donghaiensis TaxID=494016 RepID=A0A1M4ZZL0_9GAMM|nr:glycosyltransferase [Microbulbifer donghaiensis]SHF23411.1 Glycosyltransferase, catalytic subunit of cellulose synthase and poly-beta-1,6-N-acetylglucosamine synthase [Microbulbifer donghaiensis]